MECVVSFSREFIRVKISGVCNNNQDNVEGNPTPVIPKFEWELWKRV